MHNDAILSQRSKDIEGILKGFVERAEAKRKSGELTLDLLESMRWGKLSVRSLRPPHMPVKLFLLR